MTSNITNNDIYERFQDLSPQRKNELYKTLSSSQRKSLINIIKGQATENTKLNQQIDNKIHYISSIELVLSKDNVAKNPLREIVRKIVKFFHNLAYLFGYLTSDKTRTLVSEINTRADTNNTISETKLRTLIANQARKPKIPLSDLLKENGFSNTILNMSFENELSNFDLSDITFTECHFDLPFFDELKNVTFKNCCIEYARFENIRLENCNFINSEIQEAVFTSSTIENSTFESCNINCCSFEDSTLTKTSFIKCDLPGTHFLEAQISFSNINLCNLTNTVFFDQTPNFSIDQESLATLKLTKLLTVFPYNTHLRGRSAPKAFMKLLFNSNSIPIHITTHPTCVSSSLLDKEMQRALKIAGPYDPTQDSIPQRLIKIIKENPELYPQATRLFRKISFLAEFTDSFYLGGGVDIRAELYGESPEPNTDPDPDFRYALLEIGIINEVFNKGIPLLGICRGFQIVNIYFGGKLVQKVEGHNDVIHRLDMVPRKINGLYANAFQGFIIPFLSVSYHHQAITIKNRATNTIKPTATYKGVVKVSETIEGGTVPALLLQIHPEFLNAPSAYTTGNEIADIRNNLMLSSSHEVFYKILKDSAYTYNQKRRVRRQLREFKLESLKPSSLT